MRVLVTGAAGFIGRALVGSRGAAGLGARGSLRVVLTDRVDRRPTRRRDWSRRHRRPGARSTACSPTRSTASSTSPASSAAPPRPTSTLGRRVNLDATLAPARSLPRAGRARRTGRRASSTPARSRSSARRCRRASTTRRRREPTLSYGTHKRVCRAAHRRLHPARRSSTAARCACRASSSGRRCRTARSRRFNSDLIREPLAGRDYVCPVGAGRDDLDRLAARHASPT